MPSSCSASSSRFVRFRCSASATSAAAPPLDATRVPQEALGRSGSASEVRAPSSSASSRPTLVAELEAPAPRAMRSRSLSGRASVRDRGEQPPHGRPPLPRARGLEHGLRLRGRGACRVAWNRSSCTRPAGPLDARRRPRRVQSRSATSSAISSATATAQSQSCASADSARNSAPARRRAATGAGSSPRRRHSSSTSCTLPADRAARSTSCTAVGDPSATSTQRGGERRLRRGRRARRRRAPRSRSCRAARAGSVVARPSSTSARIGVGHPAPGGDRERRPRRRPVRARAGTRPSRGRAGRPRRRGRRRGSRASTPARTIAARPSASSAPIRRIVGRSSSPRKHARTARRTRRRSR